MAGVTSPLYHRSRREGVRFIVGYGLGLLAGGVLLAMLAYGAGSAIATYVPAPWRTVALVSVLVVFGVLDALGRTPHMMRQVPQAYARSIEPGWRGVIWGFDLALLFTSQKTTSLIWGALAFIVLAAPGLAGLLPITMTVLSVSLLLLGVIIKHVPDRGFNTYERLIVRSGRFLAGAVLLCVAMLQIPW